MITLPGGGPQWLRERREAAAARHEKNGLPTRHDPRWLYTDATLFTGAAAAAGPISEKQIDALAVEGLAHRAVIVDGHFAPELSTAPEGVRLLSLDSDDEVIRQHLDMAGEHGDGLSDLNGALWEGGLLVDVSRGAQAALHLIHIRTSPGVSHDRVLVHVRDGGELTLFQEESGDAEGIIVNAVTEIHAHAGARVHRDHFQDYPSDAAAAHTVLAQAWRDATIEDVNLHLGGAQSRTTHVARLLEQGSTAVLDGLYVVAGEQRTDHWTRVDHAAPDATSQSLYKGVLSGKSRGAFTGNVLVRPGSRGTSATQENRNLLLSRGALAQSTPQMEIHNDDVQARHGSTIGRLDENALFFLRSRGIDEGRARSMLTQAFAGEVLDRIAVPAVEAAIRDRIESWFQEREE